ncbi:MAG: excinuclease ABC subunit UvrC [Dehalococcoidales bacterium]|nr:excinuclease ABC subunit UvrC [Dehalococcoidales bacterium]
MTKVVEEQVKRLPRNPGVYIMKDADGTILYVGKAASLRSRVRSYFTPRGSRLTPKLERLVARVAELEFFITKTEQEALILELNLIKLHHPRYNVRLKDDKTFPYLKIDTSDAWPRIYVTRRYEPESGRYFGPFASAQSVRQTLKVLKGIFPFRACTKNITGTDPRACLEYYLGRCLAPCTGATTPQEYQDVIKQVTLFLEGRQESIIKELESRMKDASANLDFERAARYRDRIQGLNKVIEAQRIAATVRGEQDVIAFIQERDTAYVQVFFIRNSRLTGRESFVMQGAQQEKPEQVMTGFLKQFYASSSYVPPLILLQHPVEDTGIIRQWLESKRGARVSLQVPQRGNRRQLVDTVAENARQGMEQLKIKQFAIPKSLDSALAEVAKALHLPGTPDRIEGYDISNIQGRDAVGSMVVFEKGRPQTSNYRRFKIKTVAGANDYAMLQEVLKRRFRRAAQGEAADAWAVRPDLVLIDGGKGQLNAALAAIIESGASAIPVAGLAKENEEIFLPQQKEPIRLPRSSPGLQMLQRIRDEAHRFAISYHGKVHRRETFASALDGIPGIGPQRKRSLLRRFGSVAAIRQASVQELAAAPGMSESQAKKMKGYL